LKLYKCDGGKNSFRRSLRAGGFGRRLKTSTVVINSDFYSLNTLNSHRKSYKELGIHRLLLENKLIQEKLVVIGKGYGLTDFGRSFVD
jgi:hypothetical protein